MADFRYQRVFVFLFLVGAPVAFWASTRVWLTTGSFRTAASLVVATFAAVVLLFAPGLAAVALFERRFNAPTLAVRTTLVVVFAGACYWLVWWVWLLIPLAGKAGAGLIWAAVIGVLVWRPAFDSKEQRQAIGFLGLSGFLAIAFVGILGVHGGLAVAPQIASGSTFQTSDNFFPQQWMERVDSRGDLKEPALSWPLVERPPGQAAWIHPAFSIASNKEFAYEVLSAVLQSLVASAAALMLWVMGLRGGRFAAAVVLASTSSFVFFNVVFVWPKLLPAALLVFAASVLIERGRDATVASWVAVASVVGLSVMAHPGGVLAAPALLIIMWRADAWPRSKSALAAVALSGGAVIAPWVAYQAFYDHGTAIILKWHLAGFNEPGDNRSFPRVLVDQYRALTFSDWLSNRWANLTRIFGTEFLSQGVVSGVNDLRQRVLMAEAMSPMWSSGILLLALPFAFFNRRVSRPTTTVALAALGGIGIWLVVQFGPPLATTVTFNGPYGLFVLLAVALAAVAAQAFHRAVLALMCLVQVGLLLLISIPLGAQNSCYMTGMCLPITYPEGTASPSRILVPVAVVVFFAAIGFVATALQMGRPSREVPDLEVQAIALEREKTDSEPFTPVLQQQTEAVL